MLYTRFKSRFQRKYNFDIVENPKIYEKIYDIVENPKIYEKIYDIV